VLEIVNDICHLLRLGSDHELALLMNSPVLVSIRRTQNTDYKRPSGH
jgi:hypothetical protein